MTPTLLYTWFEPDVSICNSTGLLVQGSRVYRFPLQANELSILDGRQTRNIWLTHRKSIANEFLTVHFPLMVEFDDVEGANKQELPWPQILVGLSHFSSY